MIVQIKTPVLTMSSQDDNISDDVFESVEEAEVNQNTKNPSTADANCARPSSTGYRDYRPPSATRKPSDPSLKVAHKVKNRNKQFVAPALKLK